MQLIQEVGEIEYFLPLYSPDYNPIEEAFSKVKAEMKTMKMLAEITDIQTIVLLAFSCITISDCKMWIKDNLIQY